MEDHGGFIDEELDPVTPILWFVGAACVVIAGCVAAGVWMLP